MDVADLAAAGIEDVGFIDGLACNAASGDSDSAFGSVRVAQPEFMRLACRGRKEAIVQRIQPALRVDVDEVDAIDFEDT